MSITIGNIRQSLKGVSSVYLGGNLIYGKPIPEAASIKYIDFRQSTYTSGSLIWSSSNMTNSPISGVFTSAPVIESQSVKFNGTLELNATYISQSYAHTDWTVVTYYKANLQPQDIVIQWEHGDGVFANPGQSKEMGRDDGTDVFWTLVTGNSNSRYTLNEVSGAAFVNSNFIVDTITCSGSIASQYQNGVLTQTQNVGSNGSWAFGGDKGMRIMFSKGFGSTTTWLKRVQVYSRALNQAEVEAVYYDIVNGNN